MEDTRKYVPDNLQSTNEKTWQRWKECASIDDGWPPFRPSHKQVNISVINVSQACSWATMIVCMKIPLKWRSARSTDGRVIIGGSNGIITQGSTSCRCIDSRCGSVSTETTSRWPRIVAVKVIGISERRRIVHVEETCLKSNLPKVRSLFFDYDDATKERANAQGFYVALTNTSVVSGYMQSVF